MRTLGWPSESVKYPESVKEGILKQPGPKQEPTVSETCVVSQTYQSRIFALLFPITNRQWKVFQMNGSWREAECYSPGAMRK